VDRNKPCVEAATVGDDLEPFNWWVVSVDWISGGSRVS